MTDPTGGDENGRSASPGSDDPLDLIDRLFPEPEDGLEEALEEAVNRVLRLEPRLRRFLDVLFDLGIDAIVPRDWVTIDDAGKYVFGPLDPAAFDKLVRILEDRAEGIPAYTPSTPGAGQLRLDLKRVAPPVSRPKVPSSVHPAVAR